MTFVQYALLVNHLIQVKQNVRFNPEGEPLFIIFIINNINLFQNFFKFITNENINIVSILKIFIYIQLYQDSLIKINKHLSLSCKGYLKNKQSRSKKNSYPFT